MLPEVLQAMYVCNSHGTHSLIKILLDRNTVITTELKLDLRYLPLAGTCRYQSSLSSQTLSHPPGSGG